MVLPRFTYHPDPVATGSVVASETVCKVCGQARGYVYKGPVYGERVGVELDDAICPWCIADGTAHERFGAEFTNPAGIGEGYSIPWDQVPLSIIEEVTYRTPGFGGWQSERWWTHHGDAGEFLGPAGRKELDQFGPQAVAAIREETEYEGEEWEEYYAGLDRDYGPTAYVFRCRHCGMLGGYSDTH